MRSPCTATKSSPRSPQLEKAFVQQRRPKAAQNKKYTIKSPTISQLVSLPLSQRHSAKHSLNMSLPSVITVNVSPLCRGKQILYHGFGPSILCFPYSAAQYSTHMVYSPSSNNHVRLFEACPHFQASAHAITSAKPFILFADLRSYSVSISLYQF